MGAKAAAAEEAALPLLLWDELGKATRSSLRGRLEGLYGQSRGGDAGVFDSLACDKQQALLLLTKRLVSLKLWHEVRRVTNVYGEGGVGISFEAAPRLAALLRLRKDFTSLFAGHGGGWQGFRELRRPRAPLHFLYRAGEEGGARLDEEWSVHFDLYNPLSTPLGALRHLYYESLRGVTPDWREIQNALRKN